MKHCTSVIVRGIINPFKILFPVKKNRIIFESTIGNNYECNPKYLSQYLKKNYPDKFELIWIADNPEHVALLHSQGILTTEKRSFKTLYYLMTSKFIIVNHNLPEYVPLKKSQISINTWHGGGSYKKSKVDNGFDDYSRITKFVSSCKSFTKHNLKETYRLNDSQIFECGMPRNDMFFEDYSTCKDKIRNFYGIEHDKKILLYTPTYRKNKSTDNINIDFDSIVTALEKRFSNEFVVICKNHRFVSDTYAANNKTQIINAGDKLDTQELIAGSDVLMSDYSSIIWDASFTGMPCFIYAYDIEKYYENWDFYTPIDTWPFPVSSNLEELINSILNFDDAKYTADVKKHHENLGSFENGTASKQLATYIISQL